MNQEKYIGMDVHQATISVAVMDAAGKLIMECLLETKAATIIEFIRGLQGTLSVTFEEGTSAAWLHDLLKPHVQPSCSLRSAQERSVEGWQQERPDRCAQAGRVVTRQPTPSRVPRRAWGSHLKGAGAQLSDHHPRCHSGNESHQSSVSQLGDSLQLAQPSTLPVIAPSGWPRSLQPGVRLRAERLYQQLDLLQPVRLEARRELLAESHKHSAREVAAPDSFHRSDSLGFARSSLWQTPHRFLTQAATLGLQRFRRGDTR